MLKNFSKIWWRIAGSNRWPPECKSGALPAELIPLIKMVGRERLELSTPPLSRVCSNQLSYRPFCWMNSFTNIRDKEEKRGRLQCTMLSDSSKVNFWTVLRKEVIQPQVPLRLPCYDLVPVTSLTVGTSFPCGLGQRLRVLLAPMAWRAVCTRLRNIFTAVCWPAITSDSSFMQASCSLQSELSAAFWDLLTLARLHPFVQRIVGRVQP